MWPALVLTGIVALLLLVPLALPYGTPDPGVRTAPLADGLERVTWVLMAGDGFTAGLRAGDTVRPVPVDGGSREYAAFEVVSETGVTRVARLTRMWRPEVDLLFFVLGLEFLAAGLLVYFKAPDRGVAHLFLLLAGAMSVGLISGAIHIRFDTSWTLALNWLADKIAPAAFAYFFLTVPVPRCRFLARSVLWALVPLTVLFLYTVLVGPTATGVLLPANYSYILLCMVTGAAALFWPFFSRASTEHRRFWPVALAVGFSTVVFGFGSILPRILEQPYLVHPEVAVLSLATLPLGFVWAILRYRLFGVDLGPWALLRTVFETIPDPIFVVSRDGRLVNASESGLALLGITDVRQASSPFEHMLPVQPPTGPAARKQRQSILNRVLAGEMVRDGEECLQARDGAVMYMSVAGTPVRGEQGTVSLAVLVYRNITERKLQEQQLAYLSAHDPLTGIPNRRSLENALARAVARARRGTTSTLLFLDVDNFKDVNDVLGHATGDRALVELVRLLQHETRSSDMLARIGGDEFAVLLDGTNSSEAIIIAERLCRVVDEFRFIQAGQTFRLGLSIGVAVVDGHQEPSLVLSHSDAAMYRAKARGGNSVVLHEQLEPTDPTPPVLGGA